MNMTPARTAPTMPAPWAAPNSPKAFGDRPVNQVLLARYPPTPMTAVMRSASHEALGPHSRGLSPAPVHAVPMYHCPTPMTSPPLSMRGDRSGHPSPSPSLRTDSARGPPGPRSHVPPPPGHVRRFPSRSPPPPRSADASARGSRSGTPRAVAQLMEPVATHGPPTHLVPVAVTAVVPALPHPHPLQAHSFGAQSTQSLPSSGSLGSGPMMPVHAPPGHRAMSMGTLPPGAGHLAVQTLVAAPPPWATVIPPTAGRDDDLRAKLDQIQQEVRTMSLRQLEQQGSGAAGEAALENTRQRLQEIVNQRQAACQQPPPQQQVDTAEQDKKMGELQAQLAQRDQRVGEVERKLQQAESELGQTKTDLTRVREEYRVALSSRAKADQEQNLLLQHETRSRVENEADAREMRAAAEQLRGRCQELERSELDLQEKVRVLTNLKTTLDTQACEQGERERRAVEGARRLEGDKRRAEVRAEQLQAELEEVKAELEHHKLALGQHMEAEQHETRELRCCTAVLEDQLRHTQERMQRAEQEQQRAEQEHQRAEGDLRQWYQKFLEANKENSALQRTNQVQVKQLWELENQLRQERDVANICTPGEYLRLAKANEDGSLATENSRLKKALTKLQCEVDLCIRKLSEKDKLLQEYKERLQA
mmetsp:Transcript_110424/g.237627  ORF Transcript_110424/g.237627 Transcript_110424/m.237627 type:complete len:649 (+) Transcript_110424:91-2037(+)